VNQPGPLISPILYGLMTEEISHSYDGGLYGELIQNRVFKDDPAKAAHWALVQDGRGTGMMSLDATEPLSTSLPTSLRLDITAATSTQRVGAANDGWWGIPVHPNTSYRASFYARATPGFTGPITVDIESADGARIFAAGKVTGLGRDWKQYTVTLKTGDIPPSETNRFAITAGSIGTVWLNLVSLFPPTFNNRPNGNRVDLMKKLSAMKPAFLRLPGGNYLEGGSLPDRFEWRDTVGPLTARPGHLGPWGYRSSDGLGLLEFLEWCDDLKMQPVLAIFAGFALNHDYIKPGPDLARYVQDAIDEIEYATGDKSTRWGVERAKDGHPTPFHIEYVEIGNEDGGYEYDARFAQFYDAIRARYPKLKLIATSHTTTRAADVEDEHFYRSAQGMEADVHHYDTYSRTGPKIFVGEWATIEGSPTPTLNAALGDAAWLTGLERNSDVVTIASYAPLLVNVNPGGSQWPTNLIGYDALNSYGSPSYYVQQMFSLNRGDVVLPVDITASPTLAAPPASPKGMVGVGTWGTQAEFRNIKVTDAGTVLYQDNLATHDDDWHLGQGNWRAANGILSQTGGEDDDRATVGNLNWTDYTLTLQARKTGGAEGFLILFHVEDADNFVWWNVGGWGNSRTALERSYAGSRSLIGPPAAITVETGRWYDIKIVVHGADVQCYLDGKLVTQATTPVFLPAGPIFATASRDLKNDEVILKVVNIASDPQSLKVSLPGAAHVAPTAIAQVLTGDPKDVNSLAAPEKVAPKTISLTGVGVKFVHTFPAHSVSVIRLKVK
jgi:alpha-L-arabinofuranosidase